MNQYVQRHHLFINRRGRTTGIDNRFRANVIACYRHNGAIFRLVRHHDRQQFTFRRQGPFDRLHANSLHRLFVIRFAKRRLHRPNMGANGLLYYRHNRSFAYSTKACSRYTAVSAKPLGTIAYSAIPLCFSVSADMIYTLITYTDYSMPVSVIGALKLPCLRDTPNSPPLSKSCRTPS